MFKPGHFDLVITDFEMPQMKGNELATRIKQVSPAQPILMITAYAERLDDADNPVDAVLNKPFQLEDLRRAMAELLRLRQKKRAVTRLGTALQHSPATRLLAESRFCTRFFYRTFGGSLWGEYPIASRRLSGQQSNGSARSKRGALACRSTEWPWRP